MTIAELAGISPSVDTLTPHPLIESVERVGIEVELEGIPSRRWNNPYWNCIPDGSLRNNGAEFVTRGQGVGGKDLFQAITALDSHLYNQTPDGSWRCSTHVHVDVRNMTVEQLKKFILIYAIHERLLFKCSGWHRYKNNFCIALGAGQQQLKALAKYWDRNDMSFLRSMNDNWNKYTAMNLLPTTRLGTVEFRMSEAKWRKGHLVKLVNRFLAMKALAMSWEGTEQELIDHVGLLSPKVLFRKGLPRDVEVDPEDTILGLKFAGDIINTSALMAKQMDRLRNEEGEISYYVESADQVRRCDLEWYQNQGLEHLYPLTDGTFVSFEDANRFRVAGANLTRFLSEESLEQFSAERSRRRRRVDIPSEGLNSFFSEAVRGASVSVTWSQ